MFKSGDHEVVLHMSYLVAVAIEPVALDVAEKRSSTITYLATFQNQVKMEYYKRALTYFVDKQNIV